MAALVSSTHSRPDWQLREVGDEDWESVDLSEIEQQLSLERHYADGRHQGGELSQLRFI